MFKIRYIVHRKYLSWYNWGKPRASLFSRIRRLFLLRIFLVSIICRYVLVFLKVYFLHCEVIQLILHFFINFNFWMFVWSFDLNSNVIAWLIKFLSLSRLLNHIRSSNRKKSLFHIKNIREICIIHMIYIIWSLQFWLVVDGWWVILLEVIKLLYCVTPEVVN